MKKEKKKLLPKDMTRQQLENHCMMLEYQIYSVGELVERWGRNEEAIYKMAQRRGVKKVEGHKRVSRKLKPIDDPNVRDQEMEERLILAFYPDYSSEEVALKTGFSLNHVNYVARKHGVKKSKDKTLKQKEREAEMFRNLARRQE